MNCGNKDVCVHLADEAVLADESRFVVTFVIRLKVEEEEGGGEG